MAAFVDASGNPLDGGKNYKLRLPAQHPSQKLLVGHPLRQPDALDAADLSALACGQQPDQRAVGE